MWRAIFGSNYRQFGGLFDNNGIVGTLKLIQINNTVINNKDNIIVNNENIGTIFE